MVPVICRGQYLEPLAEHMVPVIEDNIWYRLQSIWYLLSITISGTAYRAHGTCYRGQYLVPLTEPMVPVIEDNIWYHLQSTWYLL
jgi:hypothetical protein